MQKITAQRLASLLQSRPLQTVFRVRDLAEMTGLKPQQINYLIRLRQSLFPKPLVDAPNARREWLRDDVLEVIRLIVFLNPKAKKNVLAAAI